MFSALRRLLGVRENERRLSDLEDKIGSLEDKTVSKADLEVIEEQLQDIKNNNVSKVSKEDEAEETILKLLKQDCDKSEIKKRILDLDICSESHFYRVWNTLEDKGYIVDQELVVKVDLE